MMSAKTRLVLAASLFIAWIGWLVYLVVQSRNPVIVSRPQVLVADMIVAAELTGDANGPEAKVKVAEVLWPAGVTPGKGEEIEVIFLTDCKTRNHGWNGAGPYLLALKKKDTVYAVQEIPASPGYPSGAPETREKFPRYRIYRATEDAVRQMRDLIAAKR
jgi:hypothetical protein